jgi:hypothetical protein
MRVGEAHPSVRVRAYIAWQDDAHRVIVPSKALDEERLGLINRYAAEEITGEAYIAAGGSGGKDNPHRR